MNKCSSCGSTEQLHIYSRNKGYVYYQCRDCGRKRQAAWRKTPAGRISTARSVRKYNATHKDRVEAWYKARASAPLGPCEVCGITDLVHRHHDDIKKPLEVMHLCATHHRDRHLELARLAESGT